jgi:hypothetical protein
VLRLFAAAADDPGQLRVAVACTIREQNASALWFAASIPSPPRSGVFDGPEGLLSYSRQDVHELKNLRRRWYTARREHTHK